MRKKLLIACTVSLVFVLVAISSVFAGNRHIHDINCGDDCVYEVVIEQTLHLDDEYGLFLTKLSSNHQYISYDGELITILYSITSYIVDDSSTVTFDDPLRRDGTLDHMVRCGGALSITYSDFHTFNASTGVCVSRIRITTNTCTRCWATRSFTSNISGCGNIHS